MFFLLQFITQTFAVAEVLLEEQQQVVGKALEDRVALLGFEGTGPGFALAHLAFELMEDLFDVPAVFVEQDDLIGGQGVVVGEVGVDHAVFGD